MPAMAMEELLKQPSKYCLVNFLEFRKITYLFRSILVIVFFFFLFLAKNILMVHDHLFYMTVSVSSAIPQVIDAIL